MKIGLNLLPLVPGVGGSWYYVRNLLRSLAQYDERNEYLAFVNGHSAAVVPSHERFRCVTVRAPMHVRAVRIAYEHAILPSAAAAHGVECMHHFFGTLPLIGMKPAVVTVHDIMVYARPLDFAQPKRFYLEAMRELAARKATLLAPVSYTTADELHRLLEVPRERMAVVRTSVLPQFQRSSPELTESFRARRNLPGEFWLCVINNRPHKNFARLLRAYGRHVETSPQAWPLIIRGDSESELSARVDAAGLSAHVQFLSEIADEEMPTLYSAASSLVFPSLFEGAGMPLLEALACGLPVAASDIPTTREFAGEAAVVFDPTDDESIAKALAQVECDDALRARMRAQGLRMAERLTDLASATACMGAYDLAQRAH